MPQRPAEPVSAFGWNQRVHSPNTNAGKICSISAPPSNWKSIAYGTGTKKMNSRPHTHIASVKQLGDARVAGRTLRSKTPEHVADEQIRRADAT